MKINISQVENPYEISDGNATEYAATLSEASSIAEDWYDFLTEQADLDELPAPNLNENDLDDLNASIRRWENEIAEAMGKESFSGHGNYHVSAADRAGLNLTVSIRD